MSAVSVADLDHARRDPVVFADLLIGEPLWPHQIEVVRSMARYRVICAGRRSGKSRTFGVLSLHRAFSVPHSKILIISASDTAAKRLFAEISGMALTSPLLSASIDEDTKSLLRLSNHSTIECVPASMKAVRSAEADLLIVDEAGFVDQSIWESAEPVVGARRGARVLICSTPWGGVEHFFRQLWSLGMDAPSGEVQSWHWPSTISPMVDRAWLEGVRARSSAEYFEREYLAEWTESSGSYFTEAELMAAVADYELLAPEDALRSGIWRDGPGWVRSLPAAAGVDWGYARDANALALVAPLEDHGANTAALGRDGLALYVPWLEADSRWAWTDFIDRIVEVARSYRIDIIASEVNGVGAYPTDDLQSRLYARRGEVGGMVAVQKVWTDVRRKQSGFGKMKGLMQSGRLVLPRHPELLKQLRGLQYEQLAGGSLRIAVPEAAGHDDLALALMQAVSCVRPDDLRRVYPAPPQPEGTQLLSAGAGLQVPRNALPCTGASSRWAWLAEGAEKGEGW